MKTVELEIYTIDHKISKSEEVHIHGIKVRKFNARSIGKEIKIPSSEFRKALEECDADVIHLHGFHSLIPYYILKANFNNQPKLVITTHYHGKGHTFFRNILFIFYKSILKKLTARADKIVCVSSYEKSLILKDFDVTEEKVVVIPNGISFEGFSSISQVQRQKNKILSVGRLEKYKNFDKVIKAMKFLGDTDFKLSIVGDGTEKANLLDLIRNLHLENRVSLKGNLSRDDLIEEYSTSTLFVLPSYYESFGIAVAEAQSLGLNVIVSNTGALSEFVEGGFAHGISLPITPEKIAHTIIEASEGKKPANIYKPYSWDKVADEIIRLYGSLN